MDKETILQQLSEDILSYAMSGSFPENEIAEAIKPDDLDDRFTEYELLLDLHFILQAEVVEFVRQLPKQLRSIRTETESVSRTQRGTVDGHINWDATIKKRYSQNPTDGSLFVCDNRSENYDIAENIVLKKVLSVIHSTLNDAEAYLKGDYAWVEETWKGNEALIDELKRIMTRNVHVRRIREPDAYEPTERMLTDAETARQAIYRDAAGLLRNRQALFEGDKDAIRSLLDNTAITPDDEDTLFELFVLFRFVSTLESMEDEQFEFKTISSGRQEVARLSGNKELVLYHDTSGKDRGLSFVADVPEADTRILSRTEKVQTVARNVANEYFTDRSDFTDHTGRPDVIVLEIRDPDSNTFEYLIAEVKNSTNTERIRQGIKEAAEYLAFLRVNEEFVFGDSHNEEYFGNNWNGLLVVQDLEAKTASVDEQADNEITILQASELETELATVLQNSIYSLDSVHS